MSSISHCQPAIGGSCADEPPCLAAALDYLQRGWSPIPLYGKKPAEAWDHWQERRPSEDDLRTAWSRHPGANVGICLGPVSGPIALDIDGLEALELAEELFGAEGLSPTLEFPTPGGGLRLLYSVPPGCPARRRCQPSFHEVPIMRSQLESLIAQIRNTLTRLGRRVKEEKPLGGDGAAQLISHLAGVNVKLRKSLALDLKGVEAEEDSTTA